MEQDVKVPGVVWVAAIIAAIALIHSNEAYLMNEWGISPFYLDMAVGLLMAVLKGMKLGTEELKVALQIIDYLTNHPRVTAPVVEPSAKPGGEVQYRGPVTVVTAQGAEFTESPIILPAAVPRPPSRMMAWLFG